jgi:hypothetical protein
MSSSLVLIMFSEAKMDAAIQFHPIPVCAFCLTLDKHTTVLCHKGFLDVNGSKQPIVDMTSIQCVRSGIWSLSKCKQT